MGRAHRSLQARPHAEQKSISIESQLRATQSALGRARQSIVEIGRQLEAERRARENAEAVSRSEQNTCREAMRLLGETVQPLRELKSSEAEHARQAQHYAERYAKLKADRQVLESELEETRTQLAEALKRSEHLKAEVHTERAARGEAEKAVSREQLAREGAVLALIDAQNAAAAEGAHHAAQVRAYAALEADHHARESQLKEVEAALAGAIELGEHLKVQVDNEQRAREEAESARDAAQLAREEGALAMLDIQNAANEQRVLAEEHAQAHTDLETKLQYIETQLKQTQACLAKSLEFAEEMKLQAQIEQRARKEVETKAQIDQQALEETVRALRKLEHAGEDQARAYSQFEARRRHVQAQLKEMEEACARAEYASYRHAQRHAEITAALEKERRAREDAEAKLESERRLRQAAEQGHGKEQAPLAFWKKLLPDSR